jgi:chaperonin GroEL
MAKDIAFHDDARIKLKKGIDTVANAVRVTIGPRGRNVALDKGYGGPTITNDGVSIAKEIELEDKFENMGAAIIKEVATKTNDTAGDGTSTATILTQALIQEGMDLMNSGINVLDIKRGIDAATKDAVDELAKMSKKIKGQEEIKQVATISAESEELGTIIAETIEKVGTDGVVTVEESNTFGVSSEVVEGMAFDKGYISPYMITNTERMEAEFKNAAILVTDKKISTIKEILPLIESLAQSGQKDLVIIADDVDGEALATFVVNKLRGAFNVLAIKAPGYGDRKKDMLQDIAVTVNATVVSEDVGMKLEDASMTVLGSADRVVATKDQTIIVGGKGTKKAIAERVSQLKAMHTNTSSKFDKDKLAERIAKLSGGVAVIKVGAATETEMKYLKLKLEDAVNATKAAIEEGIVPGGGTALTKVAEAIRNNKHKGEDVERGYQIVVEALSMPLRQIAINAGKDDGSAIVKAVQDAGANGGYNALDDNMVDDMLKDGIIDPVKVSRTALQNAASAAGIFLTTEVAITDLPKADEPAMPAGMGGGMPGMGMM